ncbi:MAG: YihY/virulence factor BrkB family protein [Desulfuromonas sp.]|nr:YihY/virulence factor BrkB family protein [Desulfuromonas sp.]
MIAMIKQKGLQWLRLELWNDGLSHGYRHVLRVVLATLVSFRRNHCIQQAAALTFTSLLALIPLLAIMFALLKGLGVHNKIEPLLLKQLSVGSEEVVNQIIQYINNTNVARLGSVGLVMLVFTVLALLSNIEKSFNQLWQVAETRSWFRRFADYFSVVTLGPLFLLAAISINTSLRNQHVVQWLLDKPVFGDALLLLFEVLPFVVIWAAFVFLYLFVPNTKVRLMSALVGGGCAGTLWLMTQWGYVNFQFGVAKYNAIYGTMAALPIFMIWLYLSWMIALLGVELCWAYQHRRSLGRLLWQTGEAPRWQPMQVLELLLLIYGRFERGDPCWSEDELLEVVAMPAGAAQASLEHLQRREVVLLADDDSSETVLVVPQLAAAAVDLLTVLGDRGDIGAVHSEVAAVALHLQQTQNSYLAQLSLPQLLEQTQSSPDQR